MWFRAIATLVYKQYGYAVAEQSKAPLVSENKQKLKDPRFAPWPGQSLKKDE